MRRLVLALCVLASCRLADEPGLGCETVYPQPDLAPMCGSHPAGCPCGPAHYCRMGVYGWICLVCPNACDGVPCTADSNCSPSLCPWSRGEPGTCEGGFCKWRFST